MSESVKCTLEVVAAPTFTLSCSRSIRAGVVGDDVVFYVKMNAVGSFTDDVELEVTGLPTGANVSYDPVDAIIAPGEILTITIDTDACSAGVTDMTVAEAA
jgi:hypothetical protein